MSEALPQRHSDDPWLTDIVAKPRASTAFAVE